MTQTSQDLDLYRSLYDDFKRRNASNSPTWLTTLRHAAFSQFATQGLPTRHDEEWRFTPLHGLRDSVFQSAQPETAQFPPAKLKGLPFTDLDAHTLVFVNGRYSEHLSQFRALPAGVRVTDLRNALTTQSELLHAYLSRYASSEAHVFTALNTAFLEDGAVIQIPRNAIVEDTIHLLFVSTAHPGNTISHPRVLILAGENARATVVETYIGQDGAATFTNAVTEVVLADNANLDHYKIQKESLQAFHIANMQVHLHRNSNFRSHSVALGGLLVRNDIGSTFNAEGAECTLNGVYLANGNRIVDNHTEIDHAQPHCDSHELYKGILDGHAHGVFNGKIFVRLDAQKTDAKQTNKTLLLSEDAQINTKPQLEIFADDVKCTHGATVGQLNTDQLFYLRTRGIGIAEARRILTRAFAGEVIDRIKLEPVRETVDSLLNAMLPQEIE